MTSPLRLSDTVLREVEAAKELKEQRKKPFLVGKEEEKKKMGGKKNPCQ